MTKNARFIFALWLIASGCAGSSTPCLANSAVTVKPDVEIKRYAVRLSDLFVGVPADIDRDIAQAPAPCKSVVYDEHVLNRLADTYRLDWQTQANVDHIVVSAACTRITTDMIRNAIMTKVKESGETKDRSFEITFDTHNLEVDLPADQKTDFKLENFSLDPATKQFRAELNTVANRGSYVMPVTGHVSVKRNVPILAHRLEAGTTISLNDLDWVQVPDEHVTADMVTEATQLVGREVRRDQAEGSMLHSRDVMPPRLVQRGTLVTLKIETPYISLTAQGKAEQDGAEGETIRVVNTQSNRVVEGVVTAPGVVEIRPARFVASAG